MEKREIGEQWHVADAEKWYLVGQLKDVFNKQILWINFSGQKVLRDNGTRMTGQFFVGTWYFPTFKSGLWINLIDIIYIAKEI